MAVAVSPTEVISALEEMGSIAANIWDKVEKRRDKRTLARLLVYHALSIHPALDGFRAKYPTNNFRVLQTKYVPTPRSWLQRIFLGGNDKHFANLALLGDAGTRAAVMLILLWIIGHKLENEHTVDTLITQVCQNGIKLRVERLSNADKATINPELWKFEEMKLTADPDLRAVFLSLRKTIKKQLPIAEGWNPYIPGVKRRHEGGAVSSCTHITPEECQHRYDVRSDPQLLLEGWKKNSVIVPGDMFTRFVVSWLIKTYQLGKEVGTMEDVDKTAHWNAHCMCNHSGDQAT